MPIALGFLSKFALFAVKFHYIKLLEHMIGSDFREGDEDSNFSVSESSGSLNGPDLFTELSFL